MFKTVLVANRGEVAERIRQTCHKMGIRCLALATEADRDLQFLQRFDDVLFLKDRRGYLDMESIVALAKANQDLHTTHLEKPPLDQQLKQKANDAAKEKAEAAEKANSKGSDSNDQESDKSK